MNSAATQLLLLLLLFLIGAAAGCIDVAGQTPVVDYGKVPDEPADIVIRDMPVRIHGLSAGSAERARFPVALAGSVENRPALPFRKRLNFPAGSIERAPAIMRQAPRPESGSVSLPPRRRGGFPVRGFQPRGIPEAGSSVSPRNVDPFN